MQQSDRQRAINPLLFDWPADAPFLKCSLCQKCGARAFPVSRSCMACGDEALSVQPLPRHGQLWTYTIQHFMPKTPYRSDETVETFRPFAIGYIELADALRIESRIPLHSGTPLQLGMDMELGFYTHRTDMDGTAVINYEFRPVTGVSL